MILPDVCEDIWPAEFKVCVGKVELLPELSSRLPSPPPSARIQPLRSKLTTTTLFSRSVFHLIFCGMETHLKDAVEGKRTEC